MIGGLGLDRSFRCKRNDEIERDFRPMVVISKTELISSISMLNEGKPGGTDRLTEV